MKQDTKAHGFAEAFCAVALTISALPYAVASYVNWSKKQRAYSSMIGAAAGACLAALFIFVQITAYSTFAELGEGQIILLPLMTNLISGIWELQARK